MTQLPPERRFFLGLGVSSLSLMIATSSLGASGASGPRLAGVRTLRAHAAGFGNRTAQTASRRGRAYTVVPSPCPTDTSSFYFDGISGADNAAGGMYSGVLAGEDNDACDYESGVAAGTGNTVGSSGQAAYSFIGGGADNAVTGEAAFVGSGVFNEATQKGSFVGAGSYGIAAGKGSFVGAGGGIYAMRDSTVAGAGNAANATDSFVGAGDLNVIGSAGTGSFIGGGGSATAAGSANVNNQISGTDSFIGAGDQNTIEGTGGFIGSGDINSIGSHAAYASIIGGNRNTANGEYASIIGGFGNVASGAYGIVAGGDANTAAGTVSLAAGYHADAAHSGSFVWSDYVSGSAAVKDTAVNQFVVRASGGTYVYSNEGATSGVKLAAGSGTWASLSDRDAKADVVPLDDASILAKVAKLPVSTWRYKTESGVRHAGPMAQDFYAAFHVGEDDRHITSIDEDGVALAAIKALNARLAEKDAQIADLERRMQRIEHDRRR